MAIDALEIKAHELIGQLGPDKLAALVHLLEVLVENDEPIIDEDRSRFQKAEDAFAKGEGIPMEDVLAEFGLKPEDFPLTR